MLSLKAQPPAFSLDGTLAGKVRRFTLAEFKNRWVVLFFYPADFSFVCPTEVKGFERRFDEYQSLGCDILAVSSDDIACHTEWVRELGGLRFPLLSDPGGATSRAYGVLDPEAGRAFRATFIINPEGRLAYAVASPANVGRSIEETLRVLKALKTGQMCPVDWKPGDPTLNPERGS